MRPKRPGYFGDLSDTWFGDMTALEQRELNAILANYRSNLRKEVRAQEYDLDPSQGSAHIPMRIIRNALRNFPLGPNPDSWA